MSWFTERRMDFIDWCLAYNGQVRRSDLMRVFGISTPQASGDLQEFMRLYPTAMKYDASAKWYAPKRHPYTPKRGAPLGVNWN